MARKEYDYRVLELVPEMGRKKIEQEIRKMASVGFRLVFITSSQYYYFERELNLINGGEEWEKK